jgi:hypothetical protein
MSACFKVSESHPSSFNGNFVEREGKEGAGKYLVELKRLTYTLQD